MSSAGDDSDGRSRPARIRPARIRQARVRADVRSRRLRRGDRLPPAGAYPEPMMHWLAELDGKRIAVDVPATSANLGAGYDCIGMALDMSNHIELEVRGWSPAGIELTVEGEGVGELVADRTNRFVVGLETALRAARGELPEAIGWRIAMRNGVPLARGLGSSAAATVGGLVAGNALLGEPLTVGDLLRLAVEIEGHPDNVAAALHGGFVVSAVTDGQPEAIRFDAPRDLRTVLFVPELRLHTSEMRAVLPASVPRDDAVANLNRVALGVAGLATGRYDLLRVLTVDLLHEQYRAAAYPQLPRLVAAARQAGAIGACLSGAGSAVIAFSDSLAVLARIEAALSAVAADEDLAGTVAIVSPRNEGAKVVPAAD